MNIRTALSWALIIFAMGLTFFLFVRPVIVPQIPQTISEADLVEAGRDADGGATYYQFKEEVGDWVKILANLSPIITVIIAFILKGRRRDDKN